jgi:hypothetical protein
MTFFTLNDLYFGYVIKRILLTCNFITEFIELVDSNNIMLARGSHNIIVFNSCNKFSIELTLILYPFMYFQSQIRQKDNWQFLTPPFFKKKKHIITCITCIKSIVLEKELFK